MRLLGLLWLLVLPVVPGHAATEYFRLQGTVPGNYGLQGYPYFYDPAVGLAPGQSVYFDFAVDTSLNVPGRPDSCSQFFCYNDYFPATYLGGSAPSGYATYGQTNVYPEGSLTWFRLTATAYVGSYYGNINGFGDRSVGTWVVGQNLALMQGTNYVNGGGIPLKLTYRGATAPPAPVPLPATGWLLASASALALIRHRRADI